MFLSVGRGSARVSYSDLKVENIKDHWSQRLFDTNTDTVLNQNERMELQKYVTTTIDLLGHGGGSGRSMDVRLMSPHFDPFVAEHHPFVFYLMTEWFFEVLISWIFLRWHGFSDQRSTNGIRYWYKKGSRNITNEPNESNEPNKPNKPNKQDTLPLMMFPGVGVGFLPYMPFFQTLGSERDLYLVELPFISLRLWGGFDVYSKFKITNFIKLVCNDHNIDQLHLIGHSFGSTCVSMAMKDDYIRNELVHEVTLIDPPPFAMQSGDIVRDFIYDPFEDGRVYLVNREPHLVHAMMRTLVYKDVVIWPEDLKLWRNPPVVVLSGNDTIVPSTKIKELLMQQRQRDLKSTSSATKTEAARVVVVWLSDIDHGGFLFDTNVLKEVERLVLKPPRPNDDCNVLYKLVTNQRSRLPLLKRKK